MRIYHTSNVVVDKPDVLHSRRFLDFGRGFYLTPIEAQARNYGQRFIRRGDPAIMNVYELSDLAKAFTRKYYCRLCRLIQFFSGANMPESSSCLPSKQV